MPQTCGKQSDIFLFIFSFFIFYIFLFFFFFIFFFYIFFWGGEEGGIRVVVKKMDIKKNYFLFNTQHCVK